ncbi:MAG: hypothetical protein CVV27_14555, partial [Candidatus Melainabacteria bacterium HGW-Melainabacteria-1]
KPTAKPTATPQPHPLTRSPASPKPVRSSAPMPAVTAAPTPVPTPVPQPDIMNHPQAMPALAAPKYFFWYLHTKDYPKAWAVLTEASRQRIVREIQLNLDNPAYSAAKVRQALDDHDQAFAPAFWDAFRATIDSEKWVQSYYVLAQVNETEGLVLTEPGAIRLKVRREAGKWAFGFAESFM